MMQLISKLIGKIDYLKRNIVVFYWQHEFSTSTIFHDSLYAYIEITSIDDVYFSSFFGEQKEMYRQWLRENNVCCVIEHDANTIAYGWVNTNDNHYLGELDLIMNLGQRVEVLYDFYTDINYRGQGLYPYLLQKMCLRNKKSKLIYAFADNKSSVKGIYKANFKYIGNLRGIYKNRYKDFINKICKE